MNAISSDPKVIAESAMQYELEGRKILLEAMEKATHPLSKATFEFLADQELKHIEVIKSYINSLAENGEFDIESLGEGITKREAGTQIKGIFAKFKADFEAAGGKEEERQEVYTVAMDMERHGHDFYEKAAEQSSEVTPEQFYRFLEEEEVKHFEIIQDTRDFLKQPDAFMAIDERWMQF